MTDATDRTKRWRASATSGDIARETVSLFHPGFSQDWHLTTWHEPFAGNVRGEEVTFTPHPFELQRPATTSSGRYEMQLNLFSTQTLIAEINAVTVTRTQAIECEFNQYFEAETDSEMTFGPLEITKIAGMSRGVSCTGTWLDFLNLGFPRTLYTPVLFPGLSR
ncbi:DUF1833 family protein [Henriciella sp.]|uniref:DUF1833 family protein n=1 Tax=Henriciella sp. TaxID=1968823 RepID=UPI000C12182C|nr:DUF1833 family protein [Henriciella sp.]PHR83096.1 MAG: hypothetical protein COA64_00125 [Henriciella sp.]